MLGPELKTHARRMALVIFFGTLVGALKSSTPWLIGQLQPAWEAGDYHKAILIPLAISGAWLISSILNYYSTFWMYYVSELIAVNLRRTLMNKYLTLNLSFFSGFVRGSGGLISRMLNDIIVIQSGFQKVADFISTPVTAIIMFGYLLYVDWKLTLFISLGLPLITTIFRKLARSVRKYSTQNQESMEDLTQIIKESLDGTRIVQSFNLQDEMRRRFEAQTVGFLKTKAKIISREEIGGSINDSVLSIFVGLLLIYIGDQTIANHLTTGNFMSYIAAVITMQDAVRKLQNAYLKMQQSSVALGRMRALLENTNVVPQIQSPKDFPKQWDEIEFRNVSFKYDATPVLNNVSLKIKRGERIALVGSSGAGKSTMINLLPRFFDPTSGQILIGGMSIDQMALDDLRRNIALVSQDVFLFSDTVERNIQSGDFSRDANGVVEAAKLANADTFIRNANGGYKARVGDRGSLFSGGEKQRISIARAIFKNAPILILDEATSALDSESELEVQKGLEHLMEGRTALIIAHRLSTISQCDRIIVMDKGEIVEQGDHQSLLSKNGAYHRFFQLQSRV
jgi:subfamily B ATP-binding cassette protein MsbA